MLRQALERVLREYQLAVKHPLKGHPLAQLITKDIPQYLSSLIPHSGRYKIEGSVGKGNWARCPWVSAFDVQITESAQSGYYPVYLFRGNMTGVYLSLNQGVTDIRENYKENPKEVLRRHATDFRGKLGEIPDRFPERRIDLTTRSETELASFYEDGNICARFYPSGALPSEEDLTHDFREMIKQYASLVDNDKDLGEEEELPAGKGTEDLRKFRQHKRYERNQRLSKEAKRIHGYICQACGFNFQKAYGIIGEGFIEAHHLRSLSKLKGLVVELDPRLDFAVLCANCHRMIHRTDDPGNVAAFKELLRP